MKAKEADVAKAALEAPARAAQAPAPQAKAIRVVSRDIDSRGEVTVSKGNGRFIASTKIAESRSPTPTGHLIARRTIQKR